MKHLLLGLLICLLPILNYAQPEESNGHIGLSLNSSVNGVTNTIRLVPGLTYLKRKNQFELGVGMNPFNRDYQKIFSSELNYKYFPNGLDNKFNMYLLSHFSWSRNVINTYYPATYNYLFLNAGYGFDINVIKNVYIGTNINLGTFTYSKNSEIPYNRFTSTNLMNEFGFNLTFQFKVGFNF